MNLRLTFSILPEGTIHPEWISSRKKLSKKTITLQNEIFQCLEKHLNGWLFYLGFKKPDKDLSPSINYFILFSNLFIETLSRVPDLETMRHGVKINCSDVELESFVQRVPAITGAEYVNHNFLNNLWRRLLETFSSLIQRHEGTVESFFTDLNPGIHLAGQVFFHLVETSHPDFPFAFMATYATGMGPDGRPVHRPLKNAVHEFDDAHYLRLLSKVYKVAERSALVKDLMETGDLFHPIRWDSTEAFNFLKEIPLYESNGVLCRIPDWWKQRSSNAGLRIRLGDQKPSLAGLNAILDFRPEIVLGEIKISETMARQILQESEGLAFIKNKWIPVDHEKLKLAIEACNKVKELEEDGFSVKDAMRLQLNPEKILNIEIDTGALDISVSSGEWLETILEKLKSPQKIADMSPGNGFKAKLREYQQKGLNWLALMDSLQFGACLADDMGLGKTVQVLAFLSILKKRGAEKASLLIIPASLMSNWLNEINTFFPELKCIAAHPDYLNQRTKPPGQSYGGSALKDDHIAPKDQPGRKTSLFMTKGSQPKAPGHTISTDELNNYDLIITTYTLCKKYEWLNDYHWNYVILDEAQAIKNPSTKQTSAVKKLKAQNKIIMSGTPIENRISDLWSLFDFLNPGLLGNKTEFNRFAKDLKNNPKGYTRLRRLISPYILRRLKTDKSVISDLPEKVEMKTYAGLTNKQILLYKKAVKDLEKYIENTEGIQRKGVVLSSLMKFKQLCNHPDQFIGTGAYKENDSGKFKRLREICETIYEKRERVLIFTQFKEMTEPLRHFLETVFHGNGLVLHGSVPVKKRQKIIETFQDDAYCPFMVLSLKAGGVGLNLTRASHVIHFDRWWNPATENQATDRAFRIGQKKNVVVHKFITRGTIEEKIDKMIEEKKALADQLVSASGEAMITDMDNKTLIKMFKLSLS